VNKDTKLDNRFNFVKTESESKMIMIDYETNWIQFLKKQGYNLFYKKDLLPQLKSSIDSNSVVVDAFQREDVRTLGFIKELCLERIKGKFTMPLFALEEIPGKWIISCGNSRALANKICGIPADDYEVVYITRSMLSGDGYVEIKNIQDFESIFDIAWMDYSIGLSRKQDDFHVTSSIISYSIYDNIDQTSKFGFAGERCYDFWARFVNENQQIPITVTCTPESKKLIVVDSLFDVTWDEQPQTEFSFKWMLEKYQNEGEVKLYCLIAAVSEPFKLHHLIPFTHRDYTGYHTEDKRLALITPHIRTGFQILPNIVK
jgi:hypothetical protein